AETGQRGYIIVGRDEFLEPYNQAASQVASHIKRLRALTADNAIQLQRIDRLEPLAASRFERLQRGIQLRREKGAAAGNRHIALGDGKEIMDQLRELIGQMEDDERALLKARAESADSTVSTGEYSIVFGTLAC